MPNNKQIKDCEADIYLEHIQQSRMGSCEFHGAISMTPFAFKEEFSLSLKKRSQILTQATRCQTFFSYVLKLCTNILVKLCMKIAWHVYVFSPKGVSPLQFSLGLDAAGTEQSNLIHFVSALYKFCFSDHCQQRQYQDFIYLICQQQASNFY